MTFSGPLFQMHKATGLDLNQELMLLKKANTEKSDKNYDPELLYVECQFCGKPVVWEPGKTTELLNTAGINPQVLDESCMIIAYGCPACHPEEIEGYTLAVVRLAGIKPEEMLQMLKPGGTA